MPLKLALFNMQKYIKEEDFATELLLRGGIKTLVRLLERETGGLAGNSLAVRNSIHCVAPLTKYRQVRTPRRSWYTRLGDRLGRTFRPFCRPDAGPPCLCVSAEHTAACYFYY